MAYMRDAAQTATRGASILNVRFPRRVPAIFGSRHVASSKYLSDSTVKATDGIVGHVEDAYLDNMKVGSSGISSYSQLVLELRYRRGSTTVAVNPRSDQKSEAFVD